MWFTIKLAWRNLFRNKRRTIISGIAIGIGLAVLIFIDALMIGMKDNMIRSSTASYMGEGQIHRDGYRLSQEAGLTVRDLDRLVQQLEKEPSVERFTQRAMSFGMVTSPANVSSVMMVGVDPGTERYLSQIDDVIAEGDFFSGEDVQDILIGSELAADLEVGLGDRIVLTVSQAGSGELAQDLFRVSGIYRFNIRELDSGFAFIRLPRAQQMLGIGSEVHEVVLKFKDIRFSLQKNNPFWSKFSTDGNEAVSWLKIMPELESILGMFWLSLLIMGLILFGIVAFGIINTLFMSLYERMFEFGVLRAVGTRSSGVGRMIIFEAGALAVVSIALGIVLGFLLTFILSKTGIDYRGIEFAGTTIRELLYPVMRISQFIIYPIAVLVFTMLIGIYPAVVAARMSVSDALRKSL